MQLMVVPAQAAVSAGEADFSIERFYTLPHLPGTSPTAPAWRGDGRTLAFLWNDEGYDFRDIWSYDLDSDSLERRTSLAGHSRTKEGARGITQFAWDNDGGFIYTLRGDLYHQTAAGILRRPAAPSIAAPPRSSFCRNCLDAASLSWAQTSLTPPLAEW